MKTDACERYLNDPEANASHLAECAECAALFGSVATKPISVQALPLAPWEGAAHRSWPLVIGGALAVLCIAAAMFTIAGVAPLNGIVHALASTIPSFTTLQLLLRYVGDGVQHAPAPLQIGVAISFLVVNTLLVVLLRRAPRGIDV
jgi:ABC-type Na+ efflux pump permease subunit